MQTEYTKLRARAAKMGKRERRLLLHAIAAEEADDVVAGSPLMYAWNKVLRAAMDAERLEASNDDE